MHNYKYFKKNVLKIKIKRSEKQKVEISVDLLKILGSLIYHLNFSNVIEVYH